MSNRAGAGGVIGKNGEFYKGGTFLPSTTLPKRSSQSRQKAKTCRVVVEPGVWAELPEGCSGSIFGTYREFMYIEADVARVCDRPDAAVKAYINKDVDAGRAMLLELVNAYNSGKRWMCRDGSII